MRALVTGGNGFIGSHVVVKLIEAGYEVLIVDNFSTSHRKNIDNIQLLVNSSLQIEVCDILERIRLKSVFRDFKPDIVLHFAGLKSVAESVKNPTLYHHVNVTGTINLLSSMEESNCNNLVFSSSATVYEQKKINLPFSETASCRPINPYGNSKYISEQILSDWVRVNNRNATALRYFNPIGAHETGILRENPLSAPNNIMPILLEVINGQRKHLEIYGNDYPTRDGTGERDYIHVQDLANAHVIAAQELSNQNGFEIFNVGTGAGTTVLELVKVMQEVVGHKIDFSVGARRQGDSPTAVASTEKINEKFNWYPKYNLKDMCLHSFRSSTYRNQV